jgi:hypothetical protein
MEEMMGLSIFRQLPRTVAGEQRAENSRLSPNNTVLGEGLYTLSKNSGRCC